MTRKKFDPKVYQDKRRIAVAVTGSRKIFRLYVWDEERLEYRAPERGMQYIARRLEDQGAKRRDVTRSFPTLDAARAWQARLTPETAGLLEPRRQPSYDEARDGPLFSEVVENWKKKRYAKIALSTQTTYEKLLRLHFTTLMDLPIRKITEDTVDDWIAALTADPDRYGKGAVRTSFRAELALFSTIVRWYAEYGRDKAFVMPLKRRHGEDVKLRNRQKVRPKDISEADLVKFLTELERHPKHELGVRLAVLATIQFYQALRVSEVAALRWEDVELNLVSPRRSRLHFRQHVLYVRGKKGLSRIEPGLKNMEGEKEHPMLPPVFFALKRLARPGLTGLVFEDPKKAHLPELDADGYHQRFLSYSLVQNAYNTAFEAAGLEYRSTHVMRHGGVRKTFDETGSDVGIAQQHLGVDRATVEIYAQRSVGAFTGYANEQWDALERPNGGDGGPKAAPSLSVANPIPSKN